MTRPYNNQSKKGNLQIVDFAVPADQRVKKAKKKKMNKYLNLAWELKNRGT